MYCPVCFQDTMKIRSSGVIKLAFNGKSRATSLFTYNLQKESHEQLLAKLRERIVDYFSFYKGFQNKVPIKSFEAYSADFQCKNACRIDMSTKVTVLGLVYRLDEARAILTEEGARHGLEVKL